jgi:transposase
MNMHIKVRELLAKAAYHGITRREIAKKAGLAITTFTNWKHCSPRLESLDRATKALDQLIAIQDLQREKMEG